jgi:cyclomaltodextrinase / maltogenic alpha-amylase / neopullulanase
LRHNHPALRRGTYQRLYAKDNIFAFIRNLNNELLLIVINSGSETTLPDLPAPTGFGEGPLSSLFGKADAQIINGRIMNLKLGPRSGIVLGKGHR